MHLITALQCNIFEAWMPFSGKKCDAFGFFHLTRERELILTSEVLGFSMGCWKLSWQMCFDAGMNKGHFVI